MKNQLKETAANLKKNKNLQKYDEASTKQAIVLRLLAILGWDTFDVSEVYPEYPVGSYNIDYALRIGDSNKVFIEVKRVKEDLTKHQDQLLKYSFQKGVKLSVLTNGTSWWFYLPLLEGSWEKRKFYSIDLLDYEFKDSDPILIDILSKENIISGSAVEKAEKIFTLRKEQESINKNLPKAWNKIIKDKNEFLIESLCDATEDICGYRPEYAAVEVFLDSHENSILLLNLQTRDIKTVNTSNSFNRNNSSSPEDSNRNSEYTLERMLGISNSRVKKHYIELRNWLLKVGDDVEETIKKTMGCYYSKSGGKKKGLVWMEPRNNNLLFHLRKGKYSDSLNKIKPDGWGGYPEVKIFSEEFDKDRLQYIKDLLTQAYKK
jgi:predicted type IV restriction endonuclease